MSLLRGLRWRRRRSFSKQELQKEFLASTMIAVALSLKLPWTKALTSINKVLEGHFSKALVRLRSGEEDLRVWLEEAPKIGFQRWMDVEALTIGSSRVAREVLKNLEEGLLRTAKMKFERMKLLSLIVAASAFIAPAPLIMGVFIVTRARAPSAIALAVHIAALVLVIRAMLRRSNFE